MGHDGLNRVHRSRRGGIRRLGFGAVESHREVIVILLPGLDVGISDNSGPRFLPKSGLSADRSRQFESTDTS